VLGGGNCHSVEILNGELGRGRVLIRAYISGGRVRLSGRMFPKPGSQMLKFPLACKGNRVKRKWVRSEKRKLTAGRPSCSCIGPK